MTRLPCFLFLLSLGCVWMNSPGDALAQGRAAIAIKKNDKNGDGRVSRDEWRKSKKIFKKIDGDGYLTLQEFQTKFGESPISTNAGPSSAKPSGDGLINVQDLDDVTKAAFIGSFRKREHELARGMVESHLIPVYPANASCPKIDHIFGEPWRGPVPNKWHSGADIPAAWD